MALSRVRRPARHGAERRSRRRTRTTAVLVVAVTAAAVLAGWQLSPVSGETPCRDGRQPLEVAAAPDLAGVVARQAEALAADGCVDVAVRASAPADVLAALREGTARPPDVWIPDSSVWLQRAAQDGLAPEHVTGVASSATVVAAAPATAAALRTGASALAPLLTGGELVLTLPDPARSAVSVGVLLELSSSVSGRPDARAVLAGVLRRVQVSESDEGASLSRPAEGVVVALTEQALHAQRRSAEVDGVLLRGSLLDYPLAVLTSDPDRRLVAEHLEAVLLSASGQKAVRQAGFRDAAQHVDPDVTRRAGLDGRAVRIAAPDAAQAVSAVRTMQAVRADARLLAVLDVSGSMGATVPGSGGLTRLELAQQAAGRGLAYYPDTTSVGLWTFSTNLTPSTDHRPLVPLTPLAGGGRGRLAEALGAVRPEAHGGTGLYDTTLAAVRAVRTGWDPQRVNAVVLISDGRNDDARSLSEQALLTALRREQGEQSVPVITIALGPDSDTAALARISTATGGASYTAQDADDIARVFLDALGQRACRPDCGPTAAP